MRVTTPRQAAVLARLTVIAGGSIERVQAAIRASSKGGRPAKLPDVIRHILRSRAARP